MTTDYAAEAAAWITRQEWFAALNLPALAEDPAEAAKMRPRV